MEDTHISFMKHTIDKDAHLINEPPTNDTLNTFLKDKSLHDSPPFSKNDPNNAMKNMEDVKKKIRLNLTQNLNMKHNLFHYAFENKIADFQKFYNITYNNNNNNVIGNISTNTKRNFPSSASPNSIDMKNDGNQQNNQQQLPKTLRQTKFPMFSKGTNLISKIPRKKSVLQILDIVPTSKSSAVHKFINTSINLDNNLKSMEMNKDKDKNKIIDGYIIDKIIGKGSYAVVRKVIEEGNANNIYAIKTYDKYKLFDTNRRKNLRREIAILSGLDHPNIIKLYKIIDTPTQIHLVMEYFGRMSLYQYLKTKSNRKLDEKEAKSIFKQITDALSYCHQRNISHRDIKLENILMNKDRKIKIIDFGFGIISPKDKLLNLFCGTPHYMAPEIINKKEYSGHLVDSWALGVLLYVLLTGKFPFKGTNEKDLGKSIIKGIYDIPDDVSTEAQQLLAKLLRVDPIIRAMVEEIVNDTWLNG